MNEHNRRQNVSKSGRLYIVPTPIGNLEDITARSVRVLGEVTVIACEDTRVTGRLLAHLKITEKRLVSLHARNEFTRIGEILHLLQSGNDIALVSDAGTPGISDPGTPLIEAVIAAGLDVESLPGPNAAMTALVASGLSTRSVLFEGFLPNKKGRQTRLKELAEYRETIVLYESPHRLLRTLENLCEYFGEERRAVLGRELTKLYEEYSRGTLRELLEEYRSRPSIKGEFVMIIEGKEKHSNTRYSEHDVEDVDE